MSACYAIDSWSGLPSIPQFGQIARRRNQIPVPARQPPDIRTRANQIEVRGRQRVERLQRENQQLECAFELAARLENEREIVLHVASDQTEDGGDGSDAATNQAAKTMTKVRKLMFDSSGKNSRHYRPKSIATMNTHVMSTKNADGLNLSCRSETGHAAPASEMRCWRIDRARVMTGDRSTKHMRAK